MRPISGALPTDRVGIDRERVRGVDAVARVHAIAAIGNPGRFFTGLQARGIEVIAHPFPDHHAFVASDIAFADALPVLMTEKDAIKCVAFAGPDVWCVPVSAEVPATFVDALVARLKAVQPSPSTRT
jgi:tetraacyldisaccharide 4'-kinase